MTLTVLGAGAFGTALAIAFGKVQPVTLWARDSEQAAEMEASRENTRRLPGYRLPDAVRVTSVLDDKSDVVLLAVPMQKLRGVLEVQNTTLHGKTLIACCKGIELKSGLGPIEVMRDINPDSSHAILTGPSFAQDIAQGLPTALTLACADANQGAALQERLANTTLRLYRTTDVVGASLGGAIKNVVAIGCGVAMGAGLGESARAALMTRGYAEMRRLALHKGANPLTLLGLSGFGDLALTCTSAQSRNMQFGMAVGAGKAFDTATTVEGAATACALTRFAQDTGLDMPITATVAALVEKRLDVQTAINRLLSRSLKEE